MYVNTGGVSEALCTDDLLTRERSGTYFKAEVLCSYNGSSSNSMIANDRPTGLHFL